MRIVTALVALLVVSVSAATSQAQWFHAGVKPVRSVDRWLGIGWSGGYHWRNPGPDSDYYNPYGEAQATYIDHAGAENSDLSSSVAFSNVADSHTRSVLIDGSVEFLGADNSIAQLQTRVDRCNSGGIYDGQVLGQESTHPAARKYVSPFANRQGK